MPIRRLEALKLKVVAAADKAGTAKDAGFTGTERMGRQDHHGVPLGRGPPGRARGASWTPGTTPPPKPSMPGSVSPGHAAVIVHATGQLPAGVSASSDRSSKTTWWRRPPGSAPTSSVGSPAARSRPSNPTRPWWTPTRTSSSAPRSKPPGTSAHSRCTTTATAPPPDTSPSLPSLPAMLEQGHRCDDRAPTHARTGSPQRRTGRLTGGTAAGSRSPSSSSTCPPTTCTTRRPPP